MMWLSSILKLGLHDLFTVQLQTLERLVGSQNADFYLKYKGSTRGHSSSNSNWEEGYHLLLPLLVGSIRGSQHSQHHLDIMCILLRVHIMLKAALG